jgi:hypothetical protein
LHRGCRCVDEGGSLPRRSARTRLVGAGEIGIVFDPGLGSEEDAVAIDLTPEDALELAAKIADVYGLHRRWLDARESDPLAHAPEPLLRAQVVGLDVEGWQLRMLLEAGYRLRDAECLARDESIDLHQAEDLARDAGPETAMEILT